MTSSGCRHDGRGSQGPKGKARAEGRERAKHAAWREAVRFVAVSQDGAGAFLNAIPMRDDMRMETWAMRISVQRRLGLPLDAACQAAAAGKKTRNKKIHDEFGDAAVNVPQQSHNTRHKCVLQRLILALRAAWGTAVRMEPKGHLGQSYNKQPDVDACNIGRGGKRFSGDVKVVCPLTSGGEHGRKGAFVAFGNTEAFYRNMVEGHGPYRAEGEGGEGEGEGDGGECEGYGGEGMEGERKSKGERGQGTGRWHTRGGRVVGGDRRIPSYGGEYRYAREDKDVDVRLLLFESFGGFGKGSARSSGGRRTCCRTS